MVFGALLPCEECSGQLVFKSDAYYCTGDVTAWTKCMVKTQTPNRKEWVTPKVSGGVNPGIYLQKNLVPSSGLVHTPGHHDCRAVSQTSLHRGHPHNQIIELCPWFCTFAHYTDVVPKHFQLEHRFVQLV